MQGTPHTALPTVNKRGTMLLAEPGSSCAPSLRARQFRSAPGPSAANTVCCMSKKPQCFPRPVADSPPPRVTPTQLSAGDPRGGWSDEGCSRRGTGLAPINGGSCYRRVLRPTLEGAGLSKPIFRAGVTGVRLVSTGVRAARDFIWILMYDKTLGTNKITKRLLVYYW